jgi:hypothetical protein
VFVSGTAADAVADLFKNKITIVQQKVNLLAGDGIADAFAIAS